ATHEVDPSWPFVFLGLDRDSRTSLDVASALIGTPGRHPSRHSSCSDFGFEAELERELREGAHHGVVPDVLFRDLPEPPVRTAKPLREQLTEPRRGELHDARAGDGGHFVRCDLASDIER